MRNVAVPWYILWVTFLGNFQIDNAYLVSHVRRHGPKFSATSNLQLAQRHSGPLLDAHRANTPNADFIEFVTVPSAKMHETCMALG